MSLIIEYLQEGHGKEAVKGKEGSEESLPERT